MIWNKFRLTTTTEAVDLVSGLLAELGIDGIEVEDNVQLSEEDKKKRTPRKIRIDGMKV